MDGAGNEDQRSEEHVGTILNRWLLLAKIAVRYILFAPRNAALTIAGTAVGVAVFVFTVAMMEGLVIFFSERILRISPTLTVFPETETTSARATRPSQGQGAVVAIPRPAPPDERPTIRGGVSWVTALAQVNGVLGASPGVSTAAVIAFGTVNEGAGLFGIDPLLEKGVTDLHRLVVEGAWDALAANPSGILLGYKLAQRLGARVGDRVAVTGETGARKDLQVVGILAVGLGSWDETTAVVNYPIAQGLAGWSSDEVSEIRLRTVLGELEGLRRQVQVLTNRRVERWEETNRAALQLFRTIGLTTYLLTGFVLVVAGFGISNKLATVILDKERDIAIMRAYGFSRSALRGLFVAQGLLLALAGVVLGCLIGLGGIAYFRAFPIRFAPRDQAVLAYTELYLANRPEYYLVVASFALAIALLSSWVTARRATRILPVEVLRGEV